MSEEGSSKPTPRMLALAAGAAPGPLQFQEMEAARYLLRAFFEKYEPEGSPDLLTSVVESGISSLAEVVESLCSEHERDGARLADWTGDDPIALMRHRIEAFHAAHVKGFTGSQIAASFAAACANGLEPTVRQLCSSARVDPQDWLGPFPRALKPAKLNASPKIDLTKSAWLDATVRVTEEMGNGGIDTSDAIESLTALLEEARADLDDLRSQVARAQEREAMLAKREDEIRRREMKLIEQRSAFRQRCDDMEQREKEMERREAELTAREEAPVQPAPSPTRRGTFRWLTGVRQNSTADDLQREAAESKVSMADSESLPKHRGSASTAAGSPTRSGMTTIRDTVARFLATQGNTAAEEVSNQFEGMAMSVMDTDQLPAPPPPMRDVSVPMACVSSVSFTEARRGATLRFSYVEEGGIQYTVNGTSPRGPINAVEYTGRDFLYFPELDKGAQMPFAEIVDVLSGIRCLCRRAGATHNIPATVHLPMYLPQSGELWEASEPPVVKENWQRCDDNRLRRLQMQRGKGELSAEELTELGVLERRSAKFIEEGLEKLEQSARPDLGRSILSIPLIASIANNFPRSQNPSTARSSSAPAVSSATEEEAGSACDPKGSTGRSSKHSSKGRAKPAPKSAARRAPLPAPGRFAPKATPVPSPATEPSSVGPPSSNGSMALKRPPPATPTAPALDVKSAASSSSDDAWADAERVVVPAAHPDFGEVGASFTRLASGGNGASTWSKYPQPSMVGKSDLPDFSLQ